MTRFAAWPLLGALGCQEPGADWVPDDGATTSSTSTSTSTSTNAVGNAGPVTSDTSTATATSDGATNDAATTTSTTGAGGSGGSTASSETTAGGAATNSETTTSTESTTTGSGGGSGSSLITNGDFSTGEADWSFAGSGTVDTASGEYCVTLTADGEVSVGWPDGVDPATLAPGTNYRLSYLAYFAGGAAPALITKVGQAFDPYQPFVEENATLTSSPMTFTHTFSVDSEEQAGVLFRVQGTAGDVVCFDDVALAAQ